jgi:hypothetical protein
VRVRTHRKCRLSGDLGLRFFGVGKQRLQMDDNDLQKSWTKDLEK